MKVIRKRFQYKAYFVADKIDIAGFKKASQEKPVGGGSSELYYQLGTSSYVHLFGYGSVVCCNMDVADIQRFLARVKPFAINWKTTPPEDDFEVEVGAENQVSISFETLTINHFDHAVNRLIMLHLGQTVAMDHHTLISQQILEEIKVYTQAMQNRGKIILGKKKSLKFIGKALTTRNEIAEHLYILDSPETTWEDEFLADVHKKLAQHFELTTRYRALETTLRIITDNLEVYISYNDHRESSRLEWIIIILIVIEVIDTLFGKLI